MPHQPSSEVVAFVLHAGCDVGQDAVGFVGGEVGEDAVVALPVWLHRCRARTVDVEFGQQMLIKRVENVVEFRERLVGVSVNRS
ncbi:hypothetical protein ACWEWI_40240 [Streptomyces sp. NPDC003753]